MRLIYLLTTEVFFGNYLISPLEESPIDSNPCVYVHASHHQHYDELFFTERNSARLV